MILILTPDDLNTNIKNGIYNIPLNKVDLDNFQWGINNLYDIDDNLVYDRDIMIDMCDTIIFQYPNEHRGMETRVLYKREE